MMVFATQQWAFKTNQANETFFFYPFDAIRESSKPSSQLTGKARAFFVNVNKQTMPAATS